MENDRRLLGEAVLHEVHQARKELEDVKTFLHQVAVADSAGDADHRVGDGLGVDLPEHALLDPEVDVRSEVIRHPGEEVVDEVIDAPTSAVWQQAANRLYSEQALLYRLILGS